MGGQWSSRLCTLEGTMSLPPGFHYQTCKETFSPLSYQLKHCFTIWPKSLGLTELLAFIISSPCVTYTRKPYKWQCAVVVRKMKPQTRVSTWVQSIPLCHTAAACLEKANSCLLPVQCHITVQSLGISQIMIPAIVILLLPPSFLPWYLSCAQGLLWGHTFC